MARHPAAHVRKSKGIGRVRSAAVKSTGRAFGKATSTAAKAGGKVVVVRRARPR